MSISLQNNDIIDLDRKYVRVPLDQDDFESLSIESQIALLDGRIFGLTLYDLLKNPLIVVLGEARSGKTTEFRLATEKLNKKGQFAFFIRLEDLIQPRSIGPKAILDILEIEEESRFEEWIKGNKEAVFFLDAVDEAKLQNPNDYLKVVRNFHKSLRSHLQKCRVIISCRVSEWRPKTDLKSLEKLRPCLIKPHDSSNENKIHLFQLCPLDEDQIKK